MARRPSSASVGLILSPELQRQDVLALPATPNRPHTHLSDTPRRPSARSTSSFKKLDGLANVSDVDPDELFTRHTISEVKAVQQRLRADADAKQEELRLMVGERYRDLLQSSTSILELAKSSKHVLGALGEMRDTVTSIGPTHLPQRVSTGEDKHLQALQSLSAHVKLLLDVPEHLWRLMEKKAYLNAAWLYLLARVVHRALSQVDDDQSWKAYGIDVMEQFPLVQRQWDTITPFRSQISHKATLFLREANSTPGEVCATLLSLHLLESRPFPETLSIYLAQRTKTLSSIIVKNASTSANGDARPNGKLAHRSRKAVVRETKQKAEAALDAISRTVLTARLTFAGDGSGTQSLMKQALQFFQAPTDKPGTLPVELQLTTQILLETLPSSSQLLVLPQSVRTYKPYIDGASVMTSSLQPHLQDKLESWFRKAVQDAGGALVDWFFALQSVQEVWDARVALLTWLQGASGLHSGERARLETIINAASEQQATSVWKNTLDLLAMSFQDAVSFATKTLEQHSGEHSHDLHPVEHLFHAPSIPSVLQTGAQSSATAAQFVKYKASLGQQLTGRTPLLDSALTTFQRHSSELQTDVAILMTPKSGTADSDLISQMSMSYRADAVIACEKIYDVLESAVALENPSLRTLVFVGRICQELASSSDFKRIGCGSATTNALQVRLRTLQNKLVNKWQEDTVSQLIRKNFVYASLNLRTEDSLTPAQPSDPLTQTLLSLSFQVQHLGVFLEENHRKHRAGSTLRRFIGTYLDHLDQKGSSPSLNDLQTLWDLVFLQRLNQLWGDDATGTSERIEANITSRTNPLTNDRSPTQSEITSSVQEYLSRTQILLAGLLPAHHMTQLDVKAPSKSEKPSGLLHCGTPAVDKHFEPALRLVKTPPRFGLLLVGGATIR